MVVSDLQGDIFDMWGNLKSYSQASIHKEVVILMPFMNLMDQGISDSLVYCSNNNSAQM